MLIIYPVSTITAVLFVHRPLGGCYMYMYSTVQVDVIKYYICLTQIGTWITSAASGLIMVTFEIQWQWLWMQGDLRPMVLDFH